MKAKAAPAKKPVAAKEPPKKAPIKSAKKAAKKSEPVKKTVSVKKANAKKPETKKPAPKAPVAKKNVPTKAAPVKKPVKTEPKEEKKVKKNLKPTEQSAKPVAPKKPEIKDAAAVAKSAVVEPKAVEKKAVASEKPKANEPVEDSVLLRSGAKMSKVVFFFEDDEQEDRSSKKKVSSEAVEKPTASMRHRASLAEETPEELYARVVQELQEENLRFTKECSNQLCTKCCRNLVSPEYRVDKDLGYCEECAEILGLGLSKEARHLNYQAKLLGADSLDEARDDDFGEAPSQQEIEEADKDLDLEDDSDIG